MDRVRVYLLDDHEIVRRGLRDVLEVDGGVSIVGESGDAAVAILEIVGLCPDVAVLDVRLPVSSGIEVCRELHSTAPRVRALMLTSYDDDQALFSAIMAGAAGYLLKSISGPDMLAAIRHVAQGESLIDPALTARVLEKVVYGPVAPPALSSLSDQERVVLSLVAEGLTNHQIANRMHLADKTVKNYVSNVLAKLGLQSRTQAAVLASRAPG